MKLEGIITCVGAQSLRMLTTVIRANASHFDNLVIATTPEDKDTQNSCNKWKLNCFITNSFTKNNAKFNRGAVINEVIDRFGFTDFICHLDGDILIKDSNFRDILEKEVTDINWMYSCRRVFIPKLSDLKDLIQGRTNEDKHWCPNGCAWGYMQIWNNNSDVIKSGAKYPESYDSSIGDWQWRNLWGQVTGANDEIYVGKLKELSTKVWHLGSPNIINADGFWD